MCRWAPDSRLPGRRPRCFTLSPRHPADAGPTTNIVFTPALGEGVYADGGVVTFFPQNLNIKIGEGNLTYTEHTEYEYLKDRGDLDTVKEGDQVPMDVKLEATFEHITQGTSEPVSPMDAIKGVGGATEWVSRRTTCASRTAWTWWCCIRRRAARPSLSRLLSPISVPRPGRSTTRTPRSRLRASATRSSPSWNAKPVVKRLPDP